jgi:hypothetical protein
MTKKRVSEVTVKMRELFPRNPMTIGELRKKYPHIVPNSLEGEGNERTVLIKCTRRGCAQTRRTRTQDAFQVKLCQEHQIEQDAVKTKARRKRWRDREKERRQLAREEKME